MNVIRIVFNICACIDGILPSISDVLFAKTPRWEKMDSRFRGNDSVAQKLIPIGIRSFLTMDFDDFSVLGLRKNKAKTKRIKANLYYLPRRAPSSQSKGAFV